MKIPILSRFFKKDDGKKETVTKEDILSVVEEALNKEVTKKRAPRMSVDPIEALDSVCASYGITVPEFAVKCMAHYVISTGGGPEDVISVAEQATRVLEKIDGLIKKEPKSVAKLTEYTNAIKSVSEFKKSVEELRKKELTAEDLIAIINKVI
jgi:hypothetical protein